MSNKPNQKTEWGERIVYQIRIKGHLGHQWLDWFESLTIKWLCAFNWPGGRSGLLKKVRDSGMPLISVKRVEPSQTTANETQQYQANK